MYTWYAEGRGCGFRLLFAEYHEFESEILLKCFPFSISVAVLRKSGKNCFGRLTGHTPKSGFHFLSCFKAEFNEIGTEI